MGIMTTTNIDRLVEQVKALTPDEQRNLRDIVDELLAKSAPQMTEDEFEQRLLEKGTISRIPAPITDLTPYRNRKLIEVKGKPLSETIIEERR
jgi:hypothetical protein